MRRYAGPLSSVIVATALVLGAGIPAGAAHVHVEPMVNFALPPVTAGCGGALALGGGAQRIPITVSTVAGQVAESVNVCIDGEGPYPFFLDTGTGESVIDAHLAARLHLRHQGSASQFNGVGCTGSSQPVAVRSWSVAGVVLTPQLLMAATLPDFGRAGQAVGLLGSDVLSRFGAVRLDFRAQTLTLGGPEGRLPKNPSAEVHGPTGPAPPAVLAQGQTGTTVPVTVVLAPGDVSLNVPVRFGHGPVHDFVVDTGATQSIVASSLGRTVHLAHSELAERQTTVCSTITTPLLHSGRWSLPGLTLHSQLLASTNFGLIGAEGISGLVGSDQLQRFAWVIFDYRGGRLILG